MGLVLSCLLCEIISKICFRFDVYLNSGVFDLRLVSGNRALPCSIYDNLFLFFSLCFDEV